MGLLSNLTKSIFAILGLFAIVNCNHTNNRNFLELLAESAKDANMKSDAFVLVDAEHRGWKFLRIIKDSTLIDSLFNNNVELCDTNFADYRCNEIYSGEIIVKDCNSGIDVTKQMKSPLVFNQQSNSYIFTFYVPAKDEFADSLYDFEDGNNDWLLQIWAEKDRDWNLIKDKISN